MGELHHGPTPIPWFRLLTLSEVRVPVIHNLEEVRAFPATPERIILTRSDKVPLGQPCGTIQASSHLPWCGPGLPTPLAPVSVFPSVVPVHRAFQPVS